MKQALFDAPVTGEDTDVHLKQLEVGLLEPRIGQHECGQRRNEEEHTRRRLMADEGVERCQHPLELPLPPRLGLVC